MDPVARGQTEWNVLESYVKDTHGSTHRGFSVSLLNAFRVERFGYAEVHNPSPALIKVNTGAPKKLLGPRLVTMVSRMANDCCFGTAPAPPTLPGS